MLARASVLLPVGMCVCVCVHSLFWPCSGPEADGEGVQAGERHPGGEGERGAADPAPGRLQQGERREQRGAHQGWQRLMMATYTYTHTSKYQTTQHTSAHTHTHTHTQAHAQTQTHDSPTNKNHTDITHGRHAVPTHTTHTSKHTSVPITSAPTATRIRSALNTGPGVRVPMETVSKRLCEATR